MCLARCGDLPQHPAPPLRSTRRCSAIPAEPQRARRASVPRIAPARQGPAQRPGATLAARHLAGGAQRGAGRPQAQCCGGRPASAGAAPGHARQAPLGRHIPTPAPRSGGTAGRRLSSALAAPAAPPHRYPGTHRCGGRTDAERRRPPARQAPRPRHISPRAPQPAHRCGARALRIHRPAGRAAADAAAPGYVGTHLNLPGSGVIGAKPAQGLLPRNVGRLLLHDLTHPPKPGPTSSAACTASRSGRSTTLSCSLGSVRARMATASTGPGL